MTGPEHYRAAIEMLDSVGEEQRLGKLVTMSDAIAAAQVHATLALAAATALARVDEPAAWFRVCGEQVATDA